MKVARKGEVSTGSLEGRGAGTEAVQGGKMAPAAEEISKSGGSPFAERLFSTLLAEIRGDLDALQARVDGTASALVAQPNQVRLDEYKDAVSHLVAFLLDKSTLIKQVQSIKRGKDGKPREFMRVEVVNDKLAELTREVLKAQKPMLDLVNRLDEIRGILMDFYDWKIDKR